MFWKGHVAILRGATSLLHANAFHMAVTVEPVAEAVRRIAESGSPITAIKRTRLMASQAASGPPRFTGYRADLPDYCFLAPSASRIGFLMIPTSANRGFMHPRRTNSCRGFRLVPATFDRT